MQQTDPFVLALQKWIGVVMQRSGRDLMSYSRDSGLSMPQLGALFQIRHRGSIGVRDLGDDLGVTSSAASQMLERMLQQGLVLRSEDPSDRRAKQIELTEKGTQVLRESIRARMGWLSDLGATLTDSEREAAISVLNLLIDKASHLGPPIEPDGGMCKEAHH